MLIVATTPISGDYFLEAFCFYHMRRLEPLRYFGQNICIISEYDETTQVNNNCQHKDLVALLVFLLTQ